MLTPLSDQIVFFKKGKFYELYEKDADIGHQEFDLKLTDRVNMRMVGVPEMSFDMWAAQFVARGYVHMMFEVVVLTRYRTKGLFLTGIRWLKWTRWRPR
jgi:DNA mismatch repair ATPase MutS